MPDFHRVTIRKGGNKLAAVQRNSTFCERREKYRRILEGLTLMSDILVRNVLKQGSMRGIYSAGDHGGSDLAGAGMYRAERL